MGMLDIESLWSSLIRVQTCIPAPAALDYPSLWRSVQFRIHLNHI